jgi:hypothetical protein
MRVTRYELIAAALLLGGLAACSNSSTGANSCTAVTTASTLGDVDISVHYQASVTGDAHITSLQYMTDAGNQTEQNPTLPWQKDVDLTGGNQAQISGNVSYGTGTGHVEYSAFGGGTQQQGENDCGGGT